jgi:hypothetical protein
MKKVRIKNLRRALGGEDDYYTGPSVREAVLSMAQDIALIMDYDYAGMLIVLEGIKEGVDYEVVEDV